MCLSSFHTFQSESVLGKDQFSAAFPQRAPVRWKHSTPINTIMMFVPQQEVRYWLIYMFETHVTMNGTKLSFYSFFILIGLGSWKDGKIQQNFGTRFERTSAITGQDKIRAELKGNRHRNSTADRNYYWYAHTLSISIKISINVSNPIILQSLHIGYLLSLLIL